MASVRITINISADTFLAWYRGSARAVIARADTGESVQFPASALQQFVQAEGVHGRFVLTFDDQFKFVSLERIKETSGLDELI
jgi:hypothetical protein